MKVKDYWGVKKGKKIKTIDFKPVHFKLDTDKDKVPDWKDCQPFNPFKQDNYNQAELIQKTNSTVQLLAQLLNEAGFIVVQFDGGFVDPRIPFPTASVVMQLDQNSSYRLFGWAKDVGFVPTQLGKVSKALLLKLPSYILLLYETENTIVLEIYPPFADSIKVDAGAGQYQQYIDQITWSGLVNMAVNDIANSIRGSRI